LNMKRFQILFLSCLVLSFTFSIFAQDKDTKEVLKEYPPEKTLDMIAKVWEVAGLLVDEKM